VECLCKISISNFKNWFCGGSELLNIKNNRSSIKVDKIPRRGMFNLPIFFRKLATTAEEQHDANS